ncbi:hypothetical protein CW751_09800 [Brumimicrobium salinarum]|uniref:SPOR domain-containing protein n=1 Tax=Brumimicrobium salinarum TaxID=2058658 RepID=A0A2I0R1B2_9FLAO|nr:SPOR domain-containing protein [Brumimicrobium salinarum]PKR80359.1 hypothetical protein CW751_09800 [Brumimicrobium salinarum]
MDKFIKQLLELHSKIILPQFGAIVIEDEETGELMFNEYLTYDDGKLSSLIQEESKKDEQEAKNMVAKFVRELQAQLDKGETYEIFQLGTFNKNDDGEIEFIGNLKSAKTKETNKVIPPTPLKDEKSTPKPVKDVVKEEPKKSNSSEVKSTPNPTPSAAEPKSARKKKNSYVEKKDKFPKSDSDKVNKQSKEDTPPKSKPVKKEKKKKENVSTSTPLKKSTGNKKEEKKEKKKKRKVSPFLWIILIILVLVAAGSVYVGLNYEKVEEYMGWNKFEGETTDKDLEKEESNAGEEEILKPETETAVEDEIEESQTEDLDAGEDNEAAAEDVVEDVVETPVNNSSSGNHHIIIGCFSEKSNANRLVQEFKQQGFDAQIIGQYGGLHFVSAQSYPTANAASANLSKVRSIKSGAWLFNN